MKISNFKVQSENPPLIPPLKKGGLGGFLIIFLGIAFLTYATFSSAADISFGDAIGITHPDKKVSPP